MKKRVSRITAAFLCMVMAVSSFLDFNGQKDVAYAAENSRPYIESEDFVGLKDAFADYFKIGVAMPQGGGWYNGDTTRAQTVKMVYNSLTTENEFKPDTNFSANSPTLYKAGKAGSEILAFCDENGIKMRYHVLLWHSQINVSIFAKDFKATSGGKATASYTDTLDEDCLVDRETLLERLKTYIYGAMEYIYSSGYADTVYAFDVVNEAVDTGKSDYLRRSYWYQIIGPEFLYYAFLYAREGENKYSKEYAGLYRLDPEGDLSSILPKLFYNDYSEWDATRVKAITDIASGRVWNPGHSMVQSDAIAPDGDGTLHGDGLIDGIGMQGHIDDNLNIDAYIRALKAYSDAAGEVHITELDVGCTHNDENRWYFQAKCYYNLFSRLIQAKEEGANLTSVTLWGLSDDATWRSGSDPLVFDRNLAKKPAYDAMLLAAQKKDFTLTLADTVKDMNDIAADFEPYQENGSFVYIKPQDTGLVARGTGHQPKIEMAPGVNHTPDVAVRGYSVLVTRQEQDATVMMDISKFSGRNVTVTAYVKTDDKLIRTGLETGETLQLSENASDGDWTTISYNTDIPKGLDSVYLYFETDGNADMYIDDISVIYTRDGEDPAPVVGQENATVTAAPKGDNIEKPAETAAPTQSAEAPESGNDTGEKKKPSPKGAIAVAVTALLAGGVVVILKKRQK